jgi:hypothetical protein
MTGADWGDNNLDLPFEKAAPGTEITAPDALIAGGIVIMATVVNVPGVGPMPGLLFRFAKPDGSGFYPPTHLIASDDQILKAWPRVQAACQAAVEAAEAQR